MKENQTTPTMVSADTSLFYYLKERLGDKKSRVEAYCDLMDKASKGFVSRFLKHHQYSLDVNQCHVTITDLAAEWHWHRATVRSFIDKMESFGLLHKTSLPKSIVISIPILPPPSEENKEEIETEEPSDTETVSDKLS